MFLNILKALNNHCKQSWLKKKIVDAKKKLLLV